jgi:hypothetical protein
MALPPDLQKKLHGFPDVLLRLLDAEIAAGNEIVEVGGGFPAPPVGAYAMLAKEVCSRSRTSGDGLDFYDRNSSSYSGEWTDAKRYFFVLEPARPYEPERAIPVAPAAVRKPEKPRAKSRPKQPATKPTLRRPDVAPSETPQPSGSAALRRFRDSQIIDYGKWRDGEGYDIAALRQLSGEERVAVERELIANADRGWREIEALAALDSPKSRQALKKALAQGNAEVRTAVLRYAPEVASPANRTAALVEAIKTADAFAGLSATLSEVENHHPRKVIEALLQGVMEAPPVAASHYAGMLLYLHGQAKAPFDWEKRPFLLQFSTEDRAARKAPYAELCRRIGRA